MEKGREGAAVQPAAEGDATVATVWQSPATVRVRVESAEGAEETLSQQGNSSLPSFLSRTGLLSIADGLRRAGLLSVDDLLQLTPRKYAAVGVGDGDTELGTRLRLKRAISSEMEVRALQRALVLVGTERIEFRMPSTATIADLDLEVSRHTGLPKDSFRLVHGDQGQSSTIAFSQDLKLSTVFASQDVGMLYLRPVGGKWPAIQEKSAPIGAQHAPPEEDTLALLDKEDPLLSALSSTNSQLSRTRSRRKTMKKNENFSLESAMLVDEREAETNGEANSEVPVYHHPRDEHGNEIKDKGEVGEEKGREEEHGDELDGDEQVEGRDSGSAVARTSPSKEFPRRSSTSFKFNSLDHEQSESAAEDLTLNLSGNMEMVARFVPTKLVRHYNAKVKMKDRVASTKKTMFLPRAASYDCIIAAILFIDISGFTPLSARLGAVGAHGIEQLSRILNKYFSAQISLVTDHGGDIIKFAGDALMAMWEENLADTRPLSCLRAAQCAMELQQKLDKYDVAAGSSSKAEVLSIKISLGYGRVTAFHVGGERQRWEFFLAGAPLVQVTLAEHQAQPGDVILSNESWKQVMENCEGSVLPSGDVKLLHVTKRIPIRRAPPLKLDARIEVPLSSYIPKAILSKIGDFASTWSRGRRESGNSAEQWASDLRTISTIFCCLAIEGGSGATEEDAHHDAELYDNIFRKMQRRIYSYDGTIRQFLVDDKGMVLIACYGLVAHENDAERATRCSMDIASDMQQIGISSSAGVSTGQVFCGLIGGETRCEYALIGDVVNMAARLMASTQGEIRCDLETYTRSCKRVVFEHLEPIVVKGKTSKVKVFKPLAGSVSAALSLRKVPLIGRDEEMSMISSQIDAFDDLSHTTSIILLGEAGIGKSKLIEKTIDCIFDHKLSVIPDKGRYETMPGDPSLRFISTILEEIWNLKPSMSLDARTSVVKSEVQKLASPFAMKHLGLLEFVIPRLDFRRNSAISMPSSSIFPLLVRMLGGFIVTDIRGRKRALVCDNAHGLDLQSWKALRMIYSALERNILLVLSLRPITANECTKKVSDYFFKRENTLCLHLRELSKAQSSRLVAAIFEVSTIPRPLATAIFNKCKGRPRFIVEIADLLLSEEKVTVEDGTCHVERDDYENLQLPDNLRAVLVSRLDQLSSSEQITLKVASVIGPVFSLTLVGDIYPSGASKLQIAEDMASLLRENLVQSMDGSGQLLLSKRRSASQFKRESLEESRKSMDALLNMRFLFVSESIRELAYSQLTFSIRGSLHKKIAEWYEYTHPNDLEVHAETLAKHWDCGNKPEKAYPYYFMAAQSCQKFGNYTGVLAAAAKARQLLTSLVDGELDSEQRLLLSRLDILIFMAYHQVDNVLAEHVTRQKGDLRAAIAFLNDGFDIAGGYCSQILQLVRMSLNQTILMQQYLNQRTLQQQKQLGARSTRSTRVTSDTSSSRVAFSSAKEMAMRECYHALREVQLTVNLHGRSGKLGLEIASQEISLLSLSYLRMRIAFLLGDDILIGVACASHSVVMTIAGFVTSAYEYIELAERCAFERKHKSDYLRAFIEAGKSLFGIYVNLELALGSGPKAVSISRQLQLTGILREQLMCTGIAAYNAGDFRNAWKHANELYFMSKELQELIQLGRSTYLRLGTLCILNNSDKAIACHDLTLVLENKLTTNLSFSYDWKSVFSLALFRSGREEDANASIGDAVAGLTARHESPAYLPAIHSFLCFVYELHAKSVELRKKSKIDRVLKVFVEVLRLLDTQVKSATVNAPYAHHWRAIMFLMRGEKKRAETFFEETIRVSSSGEYGRVRYPALLSQLKLAQIRGDLGKPDVSSPLIKRLVEAGDLHSLFVLNDLHVDGASDAFNAVIEEDVFADLFVNDNVNDAQSSAAGPSPVDGSFFSASKGDSGGDRIGIEDQDLDESVFIGRVEELKALQSVLSALLSPDPVERLGSRPLAVVGASGVGKTALLEEFVMLCPYEEVLVLRGSCRAGESQTPYFAFRQVFSELLHVGRTGTIQEKTLQLIARIEENSFWRTIPHRALLKAVLPVSLVDTNATKLMSGRTKTEATVACLVRFLAARSFSTRIIIMLDDLQWCDTDSFSLLQKIVDVDGIGIIVSSRGDGESRGHDEFMAVAQKIALMPLTLEETESFIKDSFDVKEVDKVVVSFCHSRADGVPDNVTQLLKSLLESSIFKISDDRVLTLNGKKVINRSQLEKLETPDSVRELMRAQAAKLSATSLDQLFLAATIGHHFSFALLDEAFKQRSVSSTEGTLQAATIKKLVKLGIINFDRTLAARDEDLSERETVVFFFKSSAMRDAVYEMQSETGRAANHLAVAQALEARLTSGINHVSRNVHSGGRRNTRRGSIVTRAQRSQGEDEMLPKIASHLEKAGKRVKALDFFFRSGQSLSRGGLEGAIGMFQRCLILSDELGDDVSSYMRAVYGYNLGHNLLETGETNEGLKALQMALMDLGEDPEPSAFRTALGLATIMFQDTFCCQARPLVDEGLRKEMLLRLKLYLSCAHAYSNEGQTTSSAFACIQASLCRSRMGESEDKNAETREMYATADAMLAVFLLFAGFRSKSSKVIARSLAISRSEAGLHGVWRLYMFHSLCFYMLGDFPTAKQVLSKASQEAEDLGARYYMFAFALFNTTIHAHTLDCERALHIAGKCLIFSRTANSILTRWKGWALLATTAALLRIGDREALELAVFFGAKYLQEISEDEKYQEEMAASGLSDWRGEQHCLAMAWLGNYGEAADMVIQMYQDDRINLVPANPGQFSMFVVPHICLVYLLCTWREEEEEGSQHAASPGDEVRKATPMFRAVPDGAGIGSGMSAERAGRLKELAPLALKLVTTFASSNPWVSAFLPLTHGLFLWGIGGSAQSSLQELSKAAEIAEGADMQFCKALSHLYSGILLEKLGRGKAAVEAELKKAAEQGKDRNYASGLAHQFLGSEDRRPKLRLKQISSVFAKEEQTASQT